jgi:hypothetical protein
VAPYRPQSDDVHPDVDRKLFELYRAWTPEQSIQRVWQLNEEARFRAMSGLRREHPDESERQLELRLFALRHGRELTLTFFGWDPDSGDAPDGSARL